MKELIEVIAKSLVDHPSEVVVTETVSGDDLLLELKVDPSDMGKVIGRQGRIAKAIRTVVKAATCRAAKAIADLIQDDCQVVITHSNGPQIGMIHTAMSEFHRLYTDYTATPMSVCSAMSQGYIGYDLQNAIRTELMNRGVYRTVSTLLTQVIVDPYD